MLLWAALLSASTALMAQPGLSSSQGPTPLSVGSVNITVYDLLLIGGILLGTDALLREAGHRKASLSRFMSRVVILYLSYQTLVVIPIALWVGTPLQSVLRQTEVRFFWIFLPVLFSLFEDGWTRRRTYGVLIAAALVLGVLGVYRTLVGSGAYYYTEGGGLRYRVLGPLAVMIFAWPLSLAASGLVRQRVIGGSLALLALVGQLVTNFRSGIIALASAGILGVLTAGRMRRVVLWILPATLVAAVVILVAGTELRSGFGYVLVHLLDFGSGTGADRVGRWASAWEFVQQHPMNDYVWTGRRYLVSVGFRDPHNFVLEVLQNEGIMGVVFYATILMAAARAALRHIKSDAEMRLLACVLLAYLIFSMGNANWYSPANMPLLIAAVAGIAIRAGRLTEPREAASDGRSRLSEAVSATPNGRLQPSSPLVSNGLDVRGGQGTR